MQEIEDLESDRHIDFKSIKELADPWIVEILKEIVPDGRLEGDEYLMLNPRRNDVALGSFKFNVDKNVGCDFATGERISDIIDLVSFLEQKPIKEAAKRVEELVATVSRSAAQSATAQPKPKRKRKPEAELAPQIVPVPESAPVPTFRHQFLGSASANWAYRDTAGNLLGYMVRFDPPGERKTLRPYTYRSTSSGPKWDWLGFDLPRPLYNLPEIASRPSADILIVEGEKAADAARRLAPQLVVTTTMHGAESPSKSDLSPLKGRRVTIWPDADEAGEAYAKSLRALLVEQDPEAEVSCLRITMRPEGESLLVDGFVPPEGWDAADAVQDGWNAAHFGLIYGQASEDFDLAKTCESEVADPVATPRRPRDLNAFLGSNFPDGIVFSLHQFHAYYKGYWRPLDEQSQVRRLAACFYGERATSKKISALVQLARDFLAVAPSIFTPDLSRICMRNGNLNTSTCELELHSPDHALRNRLEIDWDESARCPRWEQFLLEVFEPDSDRQQKIKFMQEWFGYCMTPDTSQEVFVWCVGGGGNGKSVLINVLQELLGWDNVGNAQMDRFSDPAARAELEGKLLNVSSEMPAEATLADSYLKQITSGEIIEAAKKYEPSRKFKSYVRLMAATNNLPRLLDRTEGFARRAVFIGFNRTFRRDERDERLTATLLGELPGIAAWAIRGLRDLRARGKFEIPASSLAAVEAYRMDSDPVARFVDECLIQVDEGGMTPDDLYRTYRHWAEEGGFKQLNKVTLGHRLGSLGIRERRSQGKKFWLVGVRPEETSVTPVRASPYKM